MTATRNPMGFCCAPNQATPDYITYHNLKDFTAYGLTACWLGSSDNDPNEDCHFARPVTAEDVTELRGYFLDTLETLIAGLWEGAFTPGQGDIEGDYQSLTIDGGEHDNNPAMLSWRVRFDKDAIMLEFADGGDGTAYWLGYDAITDRQNALKVMTEARQHAPAHNNTVFDKLTQLAKLPDQPIPHEDE